MQLIVLDGPFQPARPRKPIDLSSTAPANAVEKRDAPVPAILAPTTFAAVPKHAHRGGVLEHLPDGRPGANDLTTRPCELGGLSLASPW